MEKYTLGCSDCGEDVALTEEEYNNWEFAGEPPLYCENCVIAHD